MKRITRMKSILMSLLVVSSLGAQTNLCDDIERTRNELNACEVSNGELDIYLRDLRALEYRLPEFERGLDRCTRILGRRRNPGDRTLRRRVRNIRAEVGEWSDHIQQLSRRNTQLQRAIDEFERGRGSYECLVFQPKKGHVGTRSFVGSGSQGNAHQTAISRIGGRWSRRDKYPHICIPTNFRLTAQVSAGDLQEPGDGGGPNRPNRPSGSNGNIENEDFQEIEVSAVLGNRPSASKYRPGSTDDEFDPEND